MVLILALEIARIFETIFVAILLFKIKRIFAGYKVVIRLDTLIDQYAQLVYPVYVRVIYGRHGRKLALKYKLLNVIGDAQHLRRYAVRYLIFVLVPRQIRAKDLPCTLNSKITHVKVVRIMPVFFDLRAEQLMRRFFPVDVGADAMYKRLDGAKVEHRVEKRA